MFRYFHLSQIQSAKDESSRSKAFTHKSMKLKRCQVSIRNMKKDKEKQRKAQLKSFALNGTVRISQKKNRFFKIKVNNIITRRLLGLSCFSYPLLDF